MPFVCVLNAYNFFYEKKKQTKNCPDNLNIYTTMQEVYDQQIDMNYFFKGNVVFRNGRISRRTSILIFQYHYYSYRSIYSNDVWSLSACMITLLLLSFH